jgi:hypothetical protein
VLNSGVTVRITDRDPVNIECLVRGSGLRIEIVAQASSRAWTFYDTATVHLMQAFGSGSVHEPGHLPRTIQIQGALASWVPAQQEVVATNGTESTGGSFITVTLTLVPKHYKLALPLAKSVTTAALAVAPRGPNPGPPPS